MFPRIFSTITLAVLVFVSAASGYCSSTITSNMLAEDKRLETPVTLAAPHIYIGELLERLSTQSHVRLSTDSQDLGSGMQVAVFLSQVPLHKALNALWSLVSYQNAEWYWTRQGQAGKYEYTLVESQDAKELPASLHRDIQNMYEQEWQTMLSIYNMTPDERKEFARKNPLFKEDATNEREMSGIGFLAEALPPEVLLRVLRSQSALRIPVGDLSLQGQAFVRKEWEAEGKTVPAPKWVDVHTEYAYAGSIYPSTFIIAEGVGGIDYLGSTQREGMVHDEIAARWMLPGDKAHDPAENRKISYSQTSKVTDRLDIDPETINTLSAEESTRWWRQYTHPLELRLAQIAEATSLPMMAVLPTKRYETSLGVPYNQTVQKYLAGIAKIPSFIRYKWRDGILLTSNPASFVDDDSTIPYLLIKYLRNAEREAGGLLPLSVLAETADLLSDSALKCLADEFPVMTQVATFRNVFVLCHRFPAMASESGLPLTTNVLHILETSPGLHLKSDIPQGALAFIRISASQKAKKLSAVNAKIEIDLLSPKGAVVSYVDFTYGPSNIMN